MNNADISEKTEGVDFDCYVVINCFPLISSWTKMMPNVFIEYWHIGTKQTTRFQDSTF